MTWARSEALPRYLHHPMFVYEFGDTAFVARQADGQIVGYLLGFVAPTGDCYIHFVAVRDDARGRGLARQLYEVFAAAAAERGATALKGITSPQNEGSILFYRKLGFEMTHIDDYGGTGRGRLIMRRPLKTSLSVARRRELTLSAWESARLRPSTWPDLRVGVSASDRERPLVAGANCTTIALVLVVSRYRRERVTPPRLSQTLTWLLLHFPVHPRA